VISRTVKIQLLVFAIISALGVAYTGFTYVGIRGFFGLNFAPGPYTVHANFTASGGIFTNALVTERGVTVGKVGSLHLSPTGVTVDLDINHGVQIPADATALVADLSAVGEQYVDITPQSDSGPYLRGGSVIPVTNTSVPVDDATLLLNLDNLVTSVDRTNLAIVIKELGRAFDNTGPDLQRLIDQGNTLLASAQSALPQTLKLIDDGKTVLATQQAVSGDLQSFARNLNLLTGQLVTSDPDLRRLLDNGVTASQQLTGLLQDNANNLPIVLSNLVTLGGIQERRLSGLQALLIAYPPSVADGPLLTRSSSVPGQEYVGQPVAQFGMVVGSTPPVCTTGYGSPDTAVPNDPAHANSPANLNTLCEAPDAGPRGPSDQRGAQTAPRLPGDNTGVRGGAVGTTGNPNQKVYYSVAGYNAANDTFNTGGQTYSIGNAGLDSIAFGEASWMYLLASAAAR
jgi:phospholipid/cholesterol/gamma-HCH transport system substrate-binding protein